MPLTANTLKTRYKIMPNRQTITLAVKTSTTSTNCTVAGAHKRPMGLKELQRFAGLDTEVETAVFVLPDANLQSQTPKTGDTITDAASVVWTILGVELRLADTMWHCAVSRQRT